MQTTAIIAMTVSASYPLTHPVICFALLVLVGHPEAMLLAFLGCTLPVGRPLEQCLSCVSLFNALRHHYATAAVNVCQPVQLLSMAPAYVAHGLFAMVAHASWTPGAVVAAPIVCPAVLLLLLLRPAACILVGCGCC